MMLLVGSLTAAYSFENCCSNIPSWIGGLFRILGIVFIGIIAIRFGRSRDEDDEGTRQITGKVVQVVCGLVVFDALLELVIA